MTTPSRTPIRVLLADDHETVRKGLKLLIEAQADMQVVGEAGDGVSAIERAATLAPDVIVLDVSMPRMNGLAAARALKQNSPSLAIVALTRYADAAYVKELTAAGAAGYVLKQSASDELLRAIRAAAGGTEYLDPAVRTPDAAARVKGRPHVTDREAEVLRLMALGHSNKEIAASLDISVKTVEVHKANAMRKLQLRGRIDIVKYAQLRGWLTEA
jgi:two-component system, NarL family, response regulator NreC